ncbi:hypothetical protein [Streptomyces sp. NPDC050804]
MTGTDARPVPGDHARRYASTAITLRWVSSVVPAALALRHRAVEQAGVRE